MPPAGCHPGRRHRSGDELLLSGDDDALEVRTYDQTVCHAQAAFAPYRVAGVSIVDELLRDRRIEAAREHEYGCAIDQLPTVTILFLKSRPG